MAKPPRHRFAVGIDLGTSNCALAYVDLREKGAPSRILDIPQWTAEGRSDVSRLLPSFAYYPHPGSPATPPADATLSSAGAGTGGSYTGRHVVGLRARDVSAQEPGRVIASAKSWLAHAGVDRRARLLPWASREIPEADKLSPVEASALYLAYLRSVWDEAMAGEDGRGALVRQHVTITVPASFDQAAQKLTLEAAKLAGYPAQVRLLEEPQAAFHAWLERHPEEDALQGALSTTARVDYLDEAGTTEPKPDAPPRGLLAPGPPPLESPAYRVLVCDIGGGTTDFSLFAVVFRTDGGAQIRREAVSDHILLGGDNIDLALAHLLEQRLGGDRLDASAWQRLVAEARNLKERALTERPPADRIFNVGVSGTGGNLFAQARTASVSAGEIETLVDNGFFPKAGAHERPMAGGGLREMGLPYATDTAVTRHLARFLSSGAADGVAVDAVLFNGGALTPAYLQRRLLDLIGTWQGGKIPIALENKELDLAVARGAACHGRDLALGQRSRISGGAARSYYLEAAAPGGFAAPPGVDPTLYLLCILPLGTETEQDQRIEKLDLRLTVNAPVEFRLYEASRRPSDRTGNILRHVPGEFRRLPALRTVARLDANRTAALGVPETPVTLQVRLDSLGLLQVQLVSAHKRLTPPERWDLHFDMRALTEESEEGNSVAGEAEEPLPQDLWEKASTVLGGTLGPGVLRKLEESLGRKKGTWSRAWLRRFWEALQSGLFRRDLSLDYETAWLNAAGFFLRPGFGVVLDDYRIDQIWQVHALGPAHPKNKGVRDQYWLLWRRVAGGLSAERQKALFEEARPLLMNPAKPADEAAGMAGALERLSLTDKEALLGWLLAMASARQGQHLAHVFGALGRLLSRVPLYSGEEGVLGPEAVDRAFTAFRGWDWADPRNSQLAVLFSQASRVTGHRAIDLPGSLRASVADKLRSARAQDRLVRPVLEHVP
ncbi:MAG TPA: hypothetical protein VK465_01270, partial [Fibrobacteria bacterium]|nr:hypothetical protein [Fibrobacteria bacterium]